MESWLAKIKEYEPKSKDGMLGLIGECINIIATSVYGWSIWFNKRFLEEFSEEELKEVMDRFKGFAIDFIGFDLDWTRKKDAEEKKEAGEKTSERGLIV